jgi:hypothetical protein
MKPSHTPLGRNATAVLAAALAAPCAFALNPSLDISQYSHAPWKVSEGFSKGDRLTHMFSADPKARFMLPALVRGLETEYTSTTN